MRIERSSCNLSSGIYLVSLSDIESGAVRDDIYPVFLFTAYLDLSLVVLAAFDGDYFAVSFTYLCDTFRFSCFEKFLYSRKTLCVSPPGNTSGVEVLMVS